LCSIPNLYAVFIISFSRPFCNHDSNEFFILAGNTAYSFFFCGRLCKSTIHFDFPRALFGLIARFLQTHVILALTPDRFLLLFGQTYSKMERVSNLYDR
ncbi:MAG: hypothetical protein PHY23_09620, partial [Oscillospiraceae bacterium]|nr:hypothetical protein [Oscillospiraceae bacterium]